MTTDVTRLENPLTTFPAARAALLRLRDAAAGAGLAETTRLLVGVRASQLNGCGVCLDMHTRELLAAGEPVEKVSTVAAWREVPYFSDGERAALALTEVTTRLSDSPGVAGDVWEEAGRLHTAPQLAALVLAIATINAFNRVMVATGQVGGPWVEQVVAEDQRTARTTGRPAPTEGTGPSGRVDRAGEGGGA